VLRVNDAPASAWFTPDQECLTSILLNVRYAVIGWNLVSLGTLTESIAHPREVLTPCRDPSGWDSPLWSPEGAISYMDSLEIATGVLSLTAPSIEDWAGKERADMARRVNDYGAELVQRRPDRFGFFATPALPDVDAALTEVWSRLRSIEG
jgi:hypothetical protein